MLQNSLDRVFEALAGTLIDEIAPELDDPYARAQAMAAAELINNLSTRVEWRRDLLLTEIDAAEKLLGELDGGSGTRSTEATPTAQLAENHRALLRRVAAAVESHTPEVDDYLDEWLARESDLLRTGMYRKPGR